MDWLRDAKNQDLLKGLAGNLVGQFAPAGMRDQLQQALGQPGGAVGADAAAAATQVDPETYHGEVKAGAEALPFAQQVELGQVLTGAVASTAGDGALRDLLHEIGASAADGQLSAGEVAALALRLQQRHPDALASAVDAVRDRPELLQALLGNQALQGFLATAARRYLGGQH